MLYLGDNLKAINDGDEMQVIGTLGLAFSYRGIRREKGGMNMLDVLYIGLALGFLALSWGLVELCDRL